MPQIKNPERHIWEGWCVEDFVDALKPQFEMIARRGFYIRSGDMDTRKQVEDWCKSNQPFYKKRVPEVTEYFWKLLCEYKRRR